MFLVSLIVIINYTNEEFVDYIPLHQNVKISQGTNTVNTKYGLLLSAEIRSLCKSSLTVRPQREDEFTQCQSIYAFKCHISISQQNEVIN